MAESKHTPGPWINSTFSRFDGRPIESLDDIRRTVAASCDYSDRLELFGVTLDDGGPNERPTVVCYTGNGPNAHNNARLISAAPALLEACQFCDAAFKATADPLTNRLNSAIDRDKAVNAVRTAIKLAIG